MFDPFEIPEGETVRLTLKGTIGATSDEMAVEVPIRPWGVEVVASESGTGSESTTVFVGLPAGRTYENPEMLIVCRPVSSECSSRWPSATTPIPFCDNSSKNAARRICYPPPFTTADRAAELLAATSALQYLRSAACRCGPRGRAAHEAHPGPGRVDHRRSKPGWRLALGQRRIHRRASARMRRSFRPATASPRRPSSGRWPRPSRSGLLTDVKVLDQAVAFLSGEFAKLSGNDHETRAALLHALSTRRAASFEAANSLNRVRNQLSDPALAYLALTFANLDRASLAGELIGILGPRAKTEATAPGRPARIYWDSARSSQAVRGAAETTALVSLAYARVRPQAPELEGAVAWLTAHRAGTGWRPHKAKGPALAALASYYGHAQLAEDRYRLTVTVNDTKLAELNVTGATAGQAIPVPLKALKVGAVQPRSFRHGRSRPLRLRGHASRLHPRLHGRPEAGQPRRPRVATSLLPCAAGARRQGASDRVWRGRQSRDV